MSLPERISVYVNQEHIDLGLRHSGSRCPIALSLIPGYGKNYDIEVGFGTVTLARVGEMAEYEMDKTGTDFVWGFDSLGRANVTPTVVQLGRFSHYCWEV